MISKIYHRNENADMQRQLVWTQKRQRKMTTDYKLYRNWLVDLDMGAYLLNSIKHCYIILDMELKLEIVWCFEVYYVSVISIQVDSRYSIHIYYYYYRLFDVQTLRMVFLHSGVTMRLLWLQMHSLCVPAIQSRSSIITIMKKNLCVPHGNKKQ